MAEAESRKSYPMLSPTHWWALRKKFRQSIPGVVTDSYLATVLSMAAISARANILPFLKTLGLLDPEGKPTDRVKLWRDDDKYEAVCQAMLKEVYPDELIAAITDAKSERAKLERWFASTSGVGEAASKRMAATYALLLEADPGAQPDAERKAQPPKKASERLGAKAKELNSNKIQQQPKKDPRSSQSDDSSGQSPKQPPRSSFPEVNINLQIHISADASSDQIDQIFASMSKHLYKNG